MLTDFLDGAVADEFEGSGASGTELVEVEAGQVLSVLSVSVSVGLVAVVPDGIDFGGHALQEAYVLIFDADSECFGRGSAHTCIIWVVELDAMGQRLSALRR